MVSLFAKKSLFVLIQKVTKKIKTTRILQRSLPVLHAFFTVPVLRTFTSPKKLNRHSRHYAGPPLLSGSTKAGKTMVALSVMAGHRKFLQCMGQCAHYSRKCFQPRFCLICRAMALCGKEAFLMTSLFVSFVA